MASSGACSRCHLPGPFWLLAAMALAFRCCGYYMLPYSSLHLPWSCWPLLFCIEPPSAAIEHGICPLDNPGRSHRTLLNVVTVAMMLFFIKVTFTPFNPLDQYLYKCPSEIPSRSGLFFSGYLSSHRKPCLGDKFHSRPIQGLNYESSKRGRGCGWKAARGTDL